MWVTQFRPWGVLLVATCAAVQLSACSMPYWTARAQPLDTPEASPGTAQVLKSARLRPMALQAGLPPRPGVEVVGEAAYTVGQEQVQAEADHLRDTLRAELQSAALLDPASRWVLASTVLHSDMGKTYGTLAARFTVLRPEGQVAYERELRASATWPPALGTVGARWVAKEQSAVYQKLVAQLFNDPGFQQAVRR